MAFTKEVVLRIVLEHLQNKENSDVGSVKQLLIDKLDQEREQQQSGNRVKTVYYSSVQLQKNDILLVNEVIYDLIIERIITPGSGDAFSNDLDGIKLPHFTVTNKEKLLQKLNSLS